MGREGQWIDQPPNEPVDVARWDGDEEHAVYPEGARVKSLLRAPSPADHPFLVSGHRYLFKHAFNRYPDQFWAEVIAYRLGCLLSVPVPPAFVAWDSDNGVCGALIEWFVGYPDTPEERYVPGGDILTSIIPGYERKRGHQHNFQTIERYLRIISHKHRLRENWLAWWCDVLLFDALIGNTDRHQDNWGLLWRPGEAARMAPAFDNGTSLGHEIFPNNMVKFADRDYLDRYLRRGSHHMRWDLSDPHQAQHQDMIRRLLERYPDMREHLIGRLTAFNVAEMETMMSNMTAFDIPVPLSADRAAFVSHLTRARHAALLQAVGV